MLNLSCVTSARERDDSELSTVIRQFLSLLIFFFILSELDAAEIEATIRPSKGTVGDVFTYQVWVKSDDTVSVIFPELNIDDEYVEVFNRNDLLTLEPHRTGVEFQLRFWNVGEFEIPSYTTLIMNDGVEQKLTTPEVKIIIESVITDETPQMRSLIPPVPLPPLIKRQNSQSGENPVLEEGRDKDTVTVFMVNPPEKSLKIRINDSKGQLLANPQVIHFDSDNWQVPRIVYISAINEWREEGDHTGRISFTLFSDSAEGYREISSIDYHIKDRGPFPYWFVARLLAIILLVGILIWIWLKRTGRIYHRIETTPRISPLEIALEKLGKLNHEDVSSEAIQRFYFELSQIIREFLEHEYFFRILEMTTAEIHEVLPFITMDQEWQENLLALLERADKVKFAKEIPDQYILQTDLLEAEVLIQQAHRDWNKISTDKQEV